MKKAVMLALGGKEVAQRCFMRLTQISTNENAEPIYPWKSAYGMHIVLIAVF
jgi:hypothetical protein